MVKALAELLELSRTASGQPFQQHLIGLSVLHRLMQHIQRPVRQCTLLADPAPPPQHHRPVRLLSQRQRQRPIFFQLRRPKRPLRRAVEVAQTMLLHQQCWLGQLVKIFLSRQRKLFHGIKFPFPYAALSPHRSVS